jgi:hypothetical protein
MPYIIDGHNLIPNLGLSLRDIDDEEKLIALLQDYCRRNRIEAEIYFDNAPPGFSGARNHTPLIIHYVRAGLTADEAIAARLKRLGNEARNWVVVSSDRMVQASARRARSRVMTSEAFAERVLQSPEAHEETEKPNPEDIDLDEWLRLFGEE